MKKNQFIWKFKKEITAQSDTFYTSLHLRKTFIVLVMLYIHCSVFIRLNDLKPQFTNQV